MALSKDLFQGLDCDPELAAKTAQLSIELATEFKELISERVKKELPMDLPYPEMDILKSQLVLNQAIYGQLVLHMFNAAPLRIRYQRFTHFILSLTQIFIMMNPKGKEKEPEPETEKPLGPIFRFDN